MCALRKYNSLQSLEGIINSILTLSLGFYELVTGQKKYGTRVLLAIGGWNDSKGGKYSKLVNDPNARRAFTQHVLEFIQKHNFDGLDLDWEYPKCWQVSYWRQSRPGFLKVCSLEPCCSSLGYRRTAIFGLLLALF